MMDPAMNGQINISRNLRITSQSKPCKRREGRMTPEERAKIIARLSPRWIDGRGPPEVEKEAIRQIREAEQAALDAAAEVAEEHGCQDYNDCSTYVAQKIRALKDKK